MNLIVNSFIILLCPLTAFSANKEIPLSKTEVLKLFPSYISIILANDQLIITGRERELFGKINNALDVDGLGRNKVFNSDFVAKTAGEIEKIRAKKTHQDILRAELDVALSVLHATSTNAAFNCLYYEETIPNMATVRCSYRSVPAQGCFHTGKISISVEPKTKEGLHVYRSMIDSVDSYDFKLNCPD